MQLFLPHYFNQFVNVIWIFQETFQWNGITNKKKGQKWGKERMSFHKHDGYEHSSQEYATVENAEKEPTFNVVDFDKLQPYTGLPKVFFFPSP